MIRLAVLFLLLLLAPAHADPHAGLIPAPANDLDQALVAEVFTTALLFMAPRTLEPVTVPQMTLWSLRGLAALDASLIPDQRGDQLVLSQQARPLLAMPLPGSEDPPGWAQAAAQIAAAAWDASPAVRRAGTEGVIHNMFDELFNHLDAYSRYVGPSDAREDRGRRAGTAGIGAIVQGRPGDIMFGTVLANSPAADAGIAPGDRILAVDDRRITRQDAVTVGALVAGDPDTDVTLTLRHQGRVTTVTITRALVPPETVFAVRSGGVLMLRITGFSSDTDGRVRDELARAMAAAAPPSGILLDLRGNRGGLLRQAASTAGLLLGNQLVATTIGRDPDADHVWQGSGQDLTGGLPIVVVVDGRSASAAEIVAAALADDRRAVVIGSSTLGKGLVQTITSLPDGGELFVTWSRVLAPLGWPLQGLGVMPQICTSQGMDALRRQLAELAAGHQPMRQVLARHREARAPMPVAQILDIRNACPAAIGQDSDLDAARALLAAPATYAAALLVP